MKSLNFLQNSVLAGIQVILFEIDCATFYANLHKLFGQFISWTNWVNSGKLNWISCQVMVDMKKSLWQSHDYHPITR